jgi:hypothetical protein
MSDEQYEEEIKTIVACHSYSWNQRNLPSELRNIKSNSPNLLTYQLKNQSDLK